MTVGIDMVFDHLSHNHIELNTIFLDILLIHIDLSLDEILLFARGETIGGDDLFVYCIHQLKQ